MLKVFGPGMLESLRLVIQESANGAAQRHNWHARRRLETGNQSNEIAEQNKNKSVAKNAI